MGLTVEPVRTGYSVRQGHRTYRAALGPMEAIAPLKTDARDRLLVAIEQAISGSWEPAMMAYGTARVLMYRTINGWCYRYWEHLTMFSPVGAVIECGQVNREDAIRSAKRHLAQNAWPDLNGLDLLIGDHTAILDHLHWIGFQRTYAWAMNATTGFTESSMHQYACEHANEDRWLTPDEIAARDAARQSLRPF
jgi:hypothetical protein